MKSAVLFLIFKRPETTRQVFSAIRKARPPRLYIASDAPREGHVEEVGLCEESKKIATMVDWPCEVRTLFRKKNLGAALAVSRAITWFFKNEAEGIILEDDCLPNADFFLFCDELLERYRSNPRIMRITGFSCQMGMQHTDASYFFSRISPSSWGWATWAESWALYDHSLKEFYSFFQEKIYAIIKNKDIADHFFCSLEATKNKKVDAWDYRWLYSVLRHDGLGIAPMRSLVQNIGFSESGTHCTSPSVLTHIRSKPLGKIIHPQAIEVDDKNEDMCFRIAHKRGAASHFHTMLGECYRRIEDGEAYSNNELITIMRNCFGDSFELRRAEFLSLLHSGEYLKANDTLAYMSQTFGNAPQLLELVKIMNAFGKSGKGISNLSI